MRRQLFTVQAGCMLLLLTVYLEAGAAVKSAEQEKPLDYAVQMARSVMVRHPQVYGGWDYVTGTVLKGFEALWRETGDPVYYDYIRNTVDSVVDTEGMIEDYDLSDYNIDEIQEGRMLLMLYKETGEKKYKIAAGHLRDQLKGHPRTSEDGFWHKKIYTSQMWLDGLYMGSPFYAEFGLRFNEPAIFDDVVNQFVLIEKHLRDPETGLFYHAWDESRQMFWADPETGLSPCFWGRGLGWYMMALVDVLDYLPETHPGRQSLIHILEGLAKAVDHYQDTESGIWWQVLDQGNRRDNYLEGSASCMLVYGLAKAARLGYIPERFKETAVRGYEGIIEHLVFRDSRGNDNLVRICKSAGLGGKYTEKIRDGSYEYYVYMEPIVPNDGKGVGPYLMACIEISKLIGDKP